MMNITSMLGGFTPRYVFYFLIFSILSSCECKVRHIQEPLRGWIVDNDDFTLTSPIKNANPARDSLREFKVVRRKTVDECKGFLSAVEEKVSVAYFENNKEVFTSSADPYEVIFSTENSFSCIGRFMSDKPKESLCYGTQVFNDYKLGDELYETVAIMTVYSNTDAAVVTREFIYAMGTGLIGVKEGGLLWIRI